MSLRECLESNHRLVLYEEWDVVDKYPLDAEGTICPDLMKRISQMTTDKLCCETCGKWYPWLPDATGTRVSEEVLDDEGWYDEDYDD